MTEYDPATDPDDRATQGLLRVLDRLLAEKVSLAVYDSDPAVCTPGEAYVYTGWRWRRAHSAVIGMEAKVISPEVFQHVFFDVPLSPLHGGGPPDPIDYDEFRSRLFREQ
jgi:hypothetical protein